MNRIYKVIWSKAKNCYVVASELAKSRTKSPSSRISGKALALSVLLSLLSMNQAAHATITGQELGDQAIAIGEYSLASGNTASAIGVGAVATGNGMTKAQIEALLEDNAEKIQEIEDLKATVKASREAYAEQQYNFEVYASAANSVAVKMAQISANNDLINNTLQPAADAADADYITKKAAYDQALAELQNQLNAVTGLDFSLIDNEQYGIDYLANQLKTQTEQGTDFNLSLDFYKDYINAYINVDGNSRVNELAANAVGYYANQTSNGYFDQNGVYVDPTYTTGLNNFNLNTLQDFNRISGGALNDIIDNMGSGSGGSGSGSGGSGSGSSIDISNVDTSALGLGTGTYQAKPSSSSGGFNYVENFIDSSGRFTHYLLTGGAIGSDAQEVNHGGTYISHEGLRFVYSYGEGQTGTTSSSNSVQAMLDSSSKWVTNGADEYYLTDEQYAQNLQAVEDTVAYWKSKADTAYDSWVSANLITQQTADEAIAKYKAVLDYEKQFYKGIFDVAHYQYLYEKAAEDYGQNSAQALQALSQKDTARAHLPTFGSGYMWEDGSIHEASESTYYKWVKGDSVIYSASVNPWSTEGQNLTNQGYVYTRMDAENLGYSIVVPDVWDYTGNGGTTGTSGTITTGPTTTAAGSGLNIWSIIGGGDGTMSGSGGAGGSSSDTMTQVRDAVLKWCYENVTQSKDMVAATIRLVDDQLSGTIEAKKQAYEDAQAAKQAADTALAAKQAENANLQPTAEEQAQAEMYAQAEASVATAKAKLDADIAALEAARQALTLNQTAFDANAQAWGTGALALGSDSIAVGHEATVTGEKGIGVGTNAVVAGEESVGIGTDVSVAGNHSTVLGSQSGATSDYATVLGNGSVASTGSTNAVLVGKSNISSAADTVAIGSNINTTNANAIVIGAHAENNTDTFGANSVSLGVNAKATADNAVALGNGSVADTANTISVGTPTNTRKIVNVASATAANEATNAQQTGNSLSLSGRSLSLKSVTGETLSSVTLPETSTGGGGSGVTYSAGDHINIDENNVISTDYKAGDHINIANDGTISSDIKSGNHVTVADDGSVNADYKAGSHINIADDGTISSNIKSGSHVTVAEDGTVSADYKAGTNIDIADDGTISSKIKSGNHVTIGEDGSVNADYKAGSNINIANDGTISTKDVIVAAGDRVSVSKSTAANGDVTYTVTAKNDGAVASGDTNLVSGGTVFNETRVTVDGNYIRQAATASGNLVNLDNAIKAVADDVNNKANVSLDNINDAGKAVITGLVNVVGQDLAVVTSATDPTTKVKTFTVSVKADGAVAAGDTKAVSGDTVYRALQNIEASGGGVTYTAGDNIEISADNKISAKGEGTVASGDTKLVTGDTVFNETRVAANGNYIRQADTAAGNLVNLDNVVKGVADDLNNKANVSLNNIDDAGKTVVRNLAKESVKVIDGQNTTVTKGTDGNADTYAVNVKTDGQVAAGNTGIVTGDTVYQALQNVEGTTYTAGDNISISADNKISATGEGAVASGDTKLVTGGTVYNETRVGADGNYIRQADTAAGNLVNLDNAVKGVADGNFTAAGDTKVKNLANEAITVKAGDGAVVTKETVNGNTTYTVSALGNPVEYDSPAKDTVTLQGESGTKITNVAPGAVNASSTDAINGSQLYAVEQSVDAKLGGKLNNDFSNITPEGKRAMTDAVEVIAGNDNTAVSTAYDREGTKIFTVSALTNGQIESGNTGIVTGGQIKDALDTKANVDMDNLSTDGNIYLQQKAIESVTVASGKHADVVQTFDDEGDAIYTVNVDDTGTVTAGDTKLVTGDTVANAIATKADVDLANITEDGRRVITEATDVVSGNADTVVTSAYDVNGKKTYTVSAVANGSVAEGNTGIVNGGAVYTALQDKANVSLDNISPEGKDVITGLTEVKSGDAYTTVTSAKDENNKVTYTVGTKVDGSVAEGDTGIVTGGQVHDAILNKANVDLDNISAAGERKVQQIAVKAVSVEAGDNTSVNKTYDADGNAIYTVSATGDGQVVANDTKLVTGGTVYEALKTQADSMDDKFDQIREQVTNANGDISIALGAKADAGLTNLNDDGRNVIRQVAEEAVKVTGTGIADVTSSYDANGNITYNVDVTTGSVAQGDNHVVTGDTVYQAIQNGMEASTIHGIGIRDTAPGDTNYNGEGAVGTNSIAIGRNALAEGKNSVAIGNNAHATGEDATAWGSGEAGGKNSTAFGVGVASGIRATAWGGQTTSGGVTKRSTASGSDATAFGVGTTASGTNSTAWGYGTEATAGQSTAWGTATKASGLGATSFGNSTTAENNNATAWGTQTHAKGRQSTAFGQFTEANNYAATAFGYGIDENAMIRADGFGATAFGVATTRDTIARGTGATAFGYETQSTAQMATAFGQRTQATGAQATAFGAGSIASGRNSTAFGASSVAGNTNATAFGTESKAFGTNSLAALGGTTGEGTVETDADTHVSTVSVTKDAAGAMAIGDGSVAKESYTYAVGKDASVTATEGIALGNDTMVSANGSVALGSGSVADEVNVVSVGSADATRKIINVTAGVNDTDAVNVSQLKDAVEGLATVDLDNLSADGEDVIQAIAKDAVKVEAGERVTVTSADDADGNKVYTVSANNDGTVASGDTKLVSGDTVYNALTEVRSDMEDGLADKANVTLDNITADGKNVITGLTEVVAGENTRVTSATDANGKKTYTVDALTDGAVVANDNKIVSGGTVYNALQDMKDELTDAVADAMDTKADVDLGNITADGEKVLQEAAKSAVKVVDGQNTTVTSELDAQGNISYKVNVAAVSADGAVEAGNTGIVSGGTVYDALKSATDTINDTITENQRNTETAISGVNDRIDDVGDRIDGVDDRIDGLDIRVDAVADSVADVTNTMNDKVQALTDAVDTKANKNLGNLDTDGERKLQQSAIRAVKVADGTNTTVSSEYDANGNITYKVATATDGVVEVGNTGIVTGATVAGETRVAADGNYILAANTAAQNLKALDDALKDTDDTVAELSDNAVKYDSITKSTVTLAGENGTKLTNVAEGALSADSKDAVNGSQLFATNQNVENNATDIAGLKDLSNITPVGENVVKELAKGAVSVEAGDRVTVSTVDVNGVKTFTVSANNDGAVAAGDTNLVSGDTVYNALHAQETALTTAIDGKANVALDNITDAGKDVITGLTDVTAGENVTVDSVVDRTGKKTYTVSASADGQVVAGDTGIVSGGTVYDALQEQSDAVTGALDGKANVGLDNITDAGKDVITGLTDVVSGDEHTNVDSVVGRDGKKTYTVTTNVNGQIADGNTGLVDGGTVYEAIQNAQAETADTLSGKANVGLDNITDEGKDVITGLTDVKAGENVSVESVVDRDGKKTYTVSALADGQVAAGSTGLVNGDTVYNALQGIKDETGEALDGKANVGLDNITDAGKDVITGLTDVVAGDDYSKVESAVDRNGKKTYTVTTNVNGRVVADDAGIVTGGAVYEAIQTVKDETADTMEAKANISLDNISEAGKDVITGLTDVVAGENVAVDSVIDRTGKKTYTVSASADGQVVSGDTGIVSGDTVYNALQAQSDAVADALDGKANVGLDNITDAGKDVITGLTEVVSGDDYSKVESVVGRDGKKTYTVTMNVNGQVASGNTGIVDGGTVYEAIQDAQAETADALDGKANVGLDNITDAGKDVITGLTDVAAGENVTVDSVVDRTGKKTYTVNASANGQVASGDTGLVSGGTVYDALQTQADATADALDGKANVALDNITDAGKDVITGLTDVVSGDDYTKVESVVGRDGKKTYTVTTTVDGQIADGNNGIVTGNVVYDALKDGLDGKANIGLDNLNDAGKTVLQKSAQKAVSVVDGENTVVTSEYDADGNIAYKVKAVADGAVEIGDSRIVSGDTVAKALKDTSDSMNEVLDTKANADASNVTDAQAWADALGTGAVADGDTKLVTGDTVYQAIDAANAAMDDKLNGKANVALDNLDTAGEKKLQQSAQEAVKVAAGESVSVASAYDANGNITYTVSALTDGAAVEGNTHAVSGDTLYKSVSNITNAMDDMADEFDGKLADKADVNLGNIDADGKKVITGLTDVVAGNANTEVTSAYDADGKKTYTVSALANGSVAEGDTGIVNGGVVYDALKEQGDALNDKIDTVEQGLQAAVDGKANVALDNLTDAGNKVIQRGAQSAVKVVDGVNTKVTSDFDADGNISYKVEALADGAVALGDGKIVSGDTVAKAMDDMKSEINDGLDTKANADASNVTDAQAWADKLGTGTVAEGDTKLVNGDTVYQAIQTSADELKSAIDDKANVGLDNLTDAGKTVLQTSAQEAVKTGEGNHTVVTPVYDANGNVTYKVDVADNGAVAQGDTGLVTGGTVYDALAGQKEAVDAALDGKANVALDNINADGRKVITGLVDVVAGNENTEVTSAYDADGKKTFTVKALTDGSIADGNTGIVTGGAIYNALSGKADTSLSNLTTDGKTVLRESAQDAVKVADGSHTVVVGEYDNSGNITYKVNVADDGVVESGDTGLVTGGKVADAIDAVKAETAEALDGKANVALDNITTEGKAVITGLTDVVSGDAYTTVEKSEDRDGKVTYTVGTKVDGEVEDGNEGLVTGGKVADAIADVNDAVGEKIDDLASDTEEALAEKANISLDNLNADGEKVLQKKAIESVKVEAGTNAAVDTRYDADGNVSYVVGVQSDGQVAAGDTKVVTGDTVYNALKASNDAMNEALDGKANVSLDNITADGKKVITGLTDVVAGNANTEVTSSYDADGKKTYTVKALVDGQIAEGNTGIVDGGTVYEALSEQADEISGKLDGKANVSLDNLNTDGEKKLQQTAIKSVSVEGTGHAVVTPSYDADGNIKYSVSVNDTGAVVEGDTNLVTGGVVADAINTLADDTADKLDGKANAGLDNITPEGKAVITGLTDVKSGNEFIEVSSATDADGKVTYTVSGIVNGEVAEGNEGLVTGGQVADAVTDAKDELNDKIDGLGDSMETALEGKANTSLDNLTDGGKDVIHTIAKDAVKVEAGEHVSVDKAFDEAGNAVYTVNAVADGQIANHNYGLLNGTTVFDEVRVGEDGNYVKKANTAAENIFALDTALKNTDDVLADLKDDAVQYDSKQKGTITLKGEDGTKLTNLKDAALTDESTDAVTGRQLKAAKDDVAANAEEIEQLKDLSNITDAGKDVIKGLAKDTVQVEAGDRVTVNASEADGKMIYTVSANNNGVIEQGNGDLVSGGTVYDALSRVTADTQTALDGKANVGLDNITDEGKAVIRSLTDVVAGNPNTEVTAVTADGKTTYTVSALSDGKVEKDDAGIVTGGTVYEALEAQKGAMDEALAGKTNVDMDNLTDAGETVVKGLAQEAVKVQGKNYAEVTSETVDGNTIYTVDVKADGVVEANNTGLVTGGMVASETKVLADGYAIRKDYTAGGNLTALDASLKDVARDVESMKDNVVTYDTESKGRITLAGEDGTTIDNVKDALLYEGSKEAVNGSQLFATNNAVAENKEAIAALDDKVDTLAADTDEKLAGKANIDMDNLTDAGKQAVKDLAKEAVTVSAGDHVAVEKTEADGNVDYKVSVVVDGAIEEGNTGLVDGGTIYDAMQKQSEQIGEALDNKADLGLQNITPEGEQKIKDVMADDMAQKANVDASNVDDHVWGQAIATGEVAEGEDRAVNGDKVKAALDQLNDAVDARELNRDLSDLDNDGLNVIRDIAKGSVKVEGKGDITVEERANGDATVYTVGVNPTGAVKQGDQGLVTGGTVYDSMNALSNDVDGKLKKKADVDAGNINKKAWTDALGTGKVAQGDTGLVKGGVVYEALRQVAEENPVRVQDDVVYMAPTKGGNLMDVRNADGEGRVITGVLTNPEDASSAANVGYVNAVGNSVADNLGQRISKMGNKMNKGLASAAALAGLHPIEYDPNQKWNIAAAMGTYDGAKAGAVGVFYRPDDRTMMNAGGSFGTDENMFNVGVSYALEKGSGSSRSALQGKVERLEKENEALKNAMKLVMQKLDSLSLIGDMKEGFPDVPGDHWANNAVETLHGNGFIQGYPDGNFKGDRQMTRYEYAEMLYNALSKGAKLDSKIIAEFEPELRQIEAEKQK